MPSVWPTTTTTKPPKPLFILPIASSHGAQMFPTRERGVSLFSKKDGCAVPYNLKGRYSQLHFPDEKKCGSRKLCDLLGQQVVTGGTRVPTQVVEVSGLPLSTLHLCLTNPGGLLGPS